MRNDLTTSLKRNPALPPLAILANWVIIATAIATAHYFSNPLLTVLMLVIVGARQHALFVMIHEAAHLHIARNKMLNDWISDLFCAFPLLFDTDVYRKNHLAHHRHLNTEQDPDWVRKFGRPDWTFPFTLKQALRFVPRYVFLTGPLEWAVILWRFSGFGSRQRWQTETAFLGFKLSYFAAAAGIFAYLGLVPQALLYWFVPMFFVLPGIGRIRSVAEHFAVNYEDENNSSRDVRAGWLEGFLLSPHHVNYHLTHHTYPHIPFYNLPAAHARLRNSDEFRNAHINSSYVLPYTGSVLHDVLHGPPVRKQTLKNAA